MEVFLVNIRVREVGICHPQFPIRHHSHTSSVPPETDGGEIAYFLAYIWMTIDECIWMATKRWRYDGWLTCLWAIEYPVPIVLTGKLGVHDRSNKGNVLLVQLDMGWDSKSEVCMLSMLLVQSIKSSIVSYSLVFNI